MATRTSKCTHRYTFGRPVNCSMFFDLFYYYSWNWLCAHICRCSFHPCYLIFHWSQRQAEWESGRIQKCSYNQQDTKKIESHSSLQSNESIIFFDVWPKCSFCTIKSHRPAFFYFILNGESISKIQTCLEYMLIVLNS